MVNWLFSKFLILIGDSDGDGEYFEEYDRDGNFIQNIAVDTAQELIDTGQATVINVISEIKNFISDIDWDGIGTAIGKALAYAFTASRDLTLSLLEEIGPVVVKTVKKGYNAIAKEFSDGGVEIFAAFTSGLIFIMGFLYLIRYVYHAPIAHLGLGGA